MQYLQNPEWAEFPFGILFCSKGFMKLSMSYLKQNMMNMNKVTTRINIEEINVTFNSSSAAVRTGLFWLDNTSTNLNVRFESNSIHHQLQYALGSFRLIAQAPNFMYVSNLIQFIISCSTHWAPLA